VLFVRDLGSRNGSFVNGRYATESSLRPGDKLGVGVTTFVVFYETSEDRQN
jgi:pSer/pThr/pTyr-binding forkhead associated (FHA) protein